MENNTEKKYNAKTFRSVAIDGTLCKTFIILNKEEQSMIVVQRFLITEKPKDFKLLRKYKHYYYCQKHLAFKLNSFARVIECIEDLIKINL